MAFSTNEREPASDTTPSVIPSYVMGAWRRGEGEGLTVRDAVYGKPIARVSSDGVDLAEVLRYAREVGGPNLRAMTLHARARMLKALAQHLNDTKEALYELSYQSGTTRRDAWFDLDGGFGTFFSYSSLARRELPDAHVLLEDEALPLARDGSFAARHLLVPRRGAAVHIGAFNFPCWGMLEKLAPTLLAGMPAVVKPAPQTAYLAAAVLEAMLASGQLPEGAVQLVAGDEVDFFPHLIEQDVVTFTGSAATGKKLKAHPNVIDKAVPFTLEADSLNAAILGKSVKPEDPEFELFVREVVREMTVKAGQKCTAIRRVLVPADLIDAVRDAIAARLAATPVGDPRREAVRMGPLVDAAQRDEVAGRLAKLQESCELLYQQPLELQGGDPELGGFFPASLLYCPDPLASVAPHEIEAFGPIATLMPYTTLEEAAEIARMGRGSLVSTVATYDRDEARALVLELAAYHGRILVLNRDDAKSSTGHGSPLPQLLHGGPGRAGGGEELGGVRSLKHYMQRSALQADPTTLTAIGGEYVRGAATIQDAIHPFRKRFDELVIGESYLSHRRTVTEADIVNFANVSGDYFYAHVDELAARDSLFGQRVAHGYFLVSAAAGLFVDPRPGPVLANYGLEQLRFIQPVAIGDTIQARLTVKRKSRKEKRDGEERATGVVTWDVQLLNQHGDAVALYTILTLVERDEDEADAA